MSVLTPRVRAALLSTVCCVAFTGCHPPHHDFGVTVGKKPNEWTFTRTEQVGTFAADVVALSRWRDVDKALQPTFKIDEAAALAEVVPMTSREDRLRQRSRSFGLGIGLSPGTVSGTDTTKTTTTVVIDPQTGRPLPAPDDDEEGEDDNDPQNTRLRESTRTESFGPPTAPTATPPASSVAAAELEIPALGLEPRLRYDLAAALIQHVRLLNRQVSDSIRTNGMVPYVVTLKLNAQPIRRDLPLDTYFDVSFFLAAEKPAISADAAADIPDPKLLPVPEGEGTRLPDEGGPQTAPAAAAAGAGSTEARPGTGRSSAPTPAQLRVQKFVDTYGKPPGPNLPLSSMTFDAAVLPTARQSGAGGGATPGERRVTVTPVVFPLLSSDSLEGQLRTLSDSDTFATALALSAMFQKVGASVNASDLQAELRRRIGRRANSLLSVIRLNSNTVRIRLGAAYSPEDASDTAMMTRENVLSFVLLLPGNTLPNSEVVMAARPHLRSSVNGRRLGGEGNDADVTAVVTARLKPTGHAAQLVEHARQGDLEEFARLLPGTDLPYVAETWLTALGAHSSPTIFDDFQIKGSVVSEWPRLLPPPPRPPAAGAPLVPPLADPVLAEAGKQVVVTLANGVFLDAMDNAIVRLAYHPSVPPIPASAVTVTDSGHVLKAVFPALDTWPTVPQPAAAAPLTARAVVSTPGWNGEITVEFLPPAPITRQTFDLLKSRPTSPAGQALADLTWLPNGRLRMSQSGLRYVKMEQPTDPKQLIVSSDQGVIQRVRGRDPTVVVRVSNWKDEGYYIRLRHATIKSATAGAAGAALQADASGRWKLPGNGLITFTVENVVPALPVVVETFQLDQNGDEKLPPKVHFTLPVSD